MKLGIIGLPLAGKTTIFNAITQLKAETSDYGPGKRMPNMGAVKVPDARLDRLAEMFAPRKPVHATLEFLDIAGLSRGDSTRGDTEAQLLARIREADGLIHVIRAFENENVLHPEGSNNVARDAGIVDDELILADLAIIEKRLERVESDLKKIKSAELVKEQEILRSCQVSLEEEKPLRNVDFDKNDLRVISGYCFLTQKPELYVVNLGEEQKGKEDELLSLLKGPIENRKTRAAAFFGRLEAEIGELDEEDARAFLEDLGLSEPSLERLVQEAYAVMGVHTFFTIGDDEVRAWAIPIAACAVDAAGEIHSDIERGFIRAEVVAFDELMECGSLAKAKSEAKLRLEGKGYEVQDGDVIQFRFSV
ncbi:MAG: redox-regulated ATPase YchF [Candidatus Eisenbacteria sp.]|nr:redox-regulated ATPase YchF [Candidatus Eisenbacteria bacterium]